MIQKIKESKNGDISHHRERAIVSLRMQGIKAPAYRL
jgi:hypothetical protein